MKKSTKIIVLTVAAAFLGIVVFTVGLRAEPRQPSKPHIAASAKPIQEDFTTGTVTRETEGFTALPGYVGPAFLDGKSGRVVVLTNTVRSSTRGTDWSAQGLLRNETAGTVRTPQVTAHLFDAGHQELGTARTSVPLPSVRPGEPAPFTMRSNVPSTFVASVEWSVTYDVTPRVSTYSTSTPTTDDDGRTFQFSVFWQRAYGSSDRLYGYPQNDSANGPYPYVVVGEIHNSGSRALEAARVLAAWLDSDGRVIHMDWLTLRPAAQALKPKASTRLGAGDDVDFFYTNSDPAIAAQLSGARLVLWGTDSE